MSIEDREMPPTIFEGNAESDVLWEQKHAEAIDILRRARSFFLVATADEDGKEQIITVAGVQENIPNTIQFMAFVTQSAKTNLMAAVEQVKAEFLDGLDMEEPNESS